MSGKAPPTLGKNEARRRELGEGYRRASFLGTSQQRRTRPASIYQRCGSSVKPGLPGSRLKSPVAPLVSSASRWAHWTSSPYWQEGGKRTCSDQRFPVRSACSSASAPASSSFAMSKSCCRLRSSWTTRANLRNRSAWSRKSRISSGTARVIDTGATGSSFIVCFLASR